MAVYSTKVDLEVKQVLMYELHNINYDEYVQEKPFKINFRFVNPGNVPYKVKARLDIFKDSSKIFTGWSEEIPYKLGTDKNIEIFWYPYNITGSFRGFLRVYYATELVDDGNIEFDVKNSGELKDGIKITDLKTYDEELILTLKSQKEIENIIIIPQKYPEGWYVAQKKIDKLDENELRKVSIDYDPSLWEPGNKINFQLVTENGDYFGEYSFKLEKEGFISTAIHYSLEYLRNIFKNL